MSKRLIVLLLIVFTCLLPGCRQNINMQYLEKLVRLEHPEYKDQPVPGDILQETRAVVEKYRADLDQYGKDVEKLSNLYKSLAQKYLEIGYLRELIPTYLARVDAEKNIADKKEETLYNESLGLLLQQKGLYEKAYEYFGKALAISLNSPLLYYYRGLCAANIAKAEKLAGTPQASEWFTKAEQYYKQAIAINPDYTEALYSLAIVLVYETERPAEALTYLLRIKEKQMSNTDALFVLAAAYYMLGEYDKAVLEYDAIEKTTKSGDIKNQARANKEQILKEYGK